MEKNQMIYSFLYNDVDNKIGLKYTIEIIPLPILKRKLFHYIMEEYQTFVRRKIS